MLRPVHRRLEPVLREASLALFGAERQHVLELPKSATVWSGRGSTAARRFLDG